MTKSLEDKLKQYPNPVAMLRNSPMRPYAYPVPPEFSNWRDEQEAWTKTAVLFDQSFHMTDLYIKGPDTVRLLSDLGVNSFKGFVRDKAKQFVVCNYDGYVIGDAILFALEDDEALLIGRPPTENWVQFHAETGAYDVTVRRDERTVNNPRERETYRFQVQGPTAEKVLERVNGGPLPNIRFFNMGEISIAGRQVRCLRHGMSGAPGLEFWGPFADREAVRDAVLEAGKEFGLIPAGARAYSTVAIESGWIPSPIPAVYSGERMKSYREWLGADSFEANASLGGSMYSNNVEDYYLTPWDLGYGNFVKFDHDFIGRAALEKMAAAPHRKKVTLEWSKEDILRIFGSMYEKGDRYRHMEMPAAHYAALPYDRIVKDGRTVGLSTYPVYTANGRTWISLSIIDEDQATTGNRVKVVWGEENGGSQKPVVERHIQTEVAATVAPSPYLDVVREGYRPYTVAVEAFSPGI